MTKLTAIITAATIAVLSITACGSDEDAGDRVVGDPDQDRANEAPDNRGRGDESDPDPGRVTLTPIPGAPEYCNALGDVHDAGEDRTARFSAYTRFLTGLALNGPEVHRSVVGEVAAAYSAIENDFGPDIFEFDENLLLPETLDQLIVLRASDAAFADLAPDLEPGVRAACGSDFVDGVSGSGVLD